jgi:hypothetical protein
MRTGFWHLPIACAPRGSRRPWTNTKFRLTKAGPCGVRARSKRRTSFGDAAITCVAVARDDLFVAGSENGAVHILELREP